MPLAHPKPRPCGQCNNTRRDAKLKDAPCRWCCDVEFSRWLAEQERKKHERLTAWLSRSHNVLTTDAPRRVWWGPEIPTWKTDA